MQKSQNDQNPHATPDQNRKTPAVGLCTVLLQGQTRAEQERQKGDAFFEQEKLNNKPQQAFGRRFGRHLEKDAAVGIGRGHGRQVDKGKTENGEPPHDVETPHTPGLLHRAGSGKGRGRREGGRHPRNQGKICRESQGLAVCLKLVILIYDMDAAR